jgi:hypothetical protein
MGMTLNYRSLEAKAPTIEQIAARKKRLKQALSKKEHALLSSKKKAKAKQRHSALAATRRPHPEQEPGPLTIIHVPDQTGGYVRSNPQSGAR